MKIRTCTLLLFTLVWAPMKTSALSLDESGYGQALIFPIFSATQRNSSLITIVNDLIPEPEPEPEPAPRTSTALKVRVMGSVEGAELASFNLYLGRRDTWVAAIYENQGETVISTTDESCVFPAPKDDILSIISESIGSIEVIQMGTVADENLAAEINDNDCASLHARWTDGEWIETPKLI